MQRFKEFITELEFLEVEFLAILFVLIPIWIIYLAIRDILNKRQTIKHNFPVVGRLRYLLESIGPELRQYIVASNREELPFNRSQRSWVYASSKKQNNYEGFGTDKDIYAPGHVFINPAMFAYQLPENHPNLKDPHFLPCAKVMGEYNQRKRPFRPYSLGNISAMSFGSLSRNAVTALNRGAHTSGCYHNTGEGSLSPYHSHGSDVMFHFGTGYYGVRNKDGNFSMDKLVELVEKNSFIRAVEIKLSQGAKPGKGGILPASKITKEIAEIRGLPMGKDILSPASHTAFTNVPEMLDFIEDVAENTGLPVGFKSAVGQLKMWEELADLMVQRGKGPDFITIDGGEGGTGAAPHSFADHVSLPFAFAFTSVYQIFLERGLTDRVVFVASGRLGFPAKALMAMAMGADLIQMAREPMMAIGCIQAQVCHTNKCPAGVATQNKWLSSGLDPTFKSVRFHNYMTAFRKEVLQISHACGYEHPCQITMHDIEVGMGASRSTQTLADNYGYTKTPVEFKGMQSLLDCPHLGGLGKNITSVEALTKVKATH
ncbi:FMN-binding glutamate synthase family protein [Microscilla marina]|uniref:Glutamate synthase n=1 Tax=Microscilla marina ATCC 23134 TaxID=313606 RepID=A1ZG63_MICM2|nr:FMN-binding glutamate synthase family protein [Microscilla marina]EAY30480.1 glutamate synthase [Microscilla marina ATCC 23134]